MRKVQLFILGDDLCHEIGNAEKDSLGNEEVVNTRKEICGAFVNEMNLTIVNYTKHSINYTFDKFNAKEEFKDSSQEEDVFRYENVSLRIIDKSKHRFVILYPNPGRH